MSGRELWRYNGGELSMVYDYLGQDNEYITISNMSPQSITELDGQVFFVGGNARDLWATDGTEAGTWLVKAYESVGGVARLQTHGNLLLISADYNDEGHEVWVSDSLGGEPQLIGDLTTLEPSVNGSSTSAYYSSVLVRYSTGGLKFNGYTLIRGISIDPLTQRARSNLWLTDGTPNEAFPLIDHYTNSTLDVSDWHMVFVFDNKLFFTGLTNSNGAELWMSDGTPGSEMMVADIARNDESSFPYGYWSDGTVMYFFANTSRKGIELWKLTKESSDGSGGGKGGGKRKK